MAFRYQQARPASNLGAAAKAERDRRLALGFDYDFGDARGVHHVGTTDEDMKAWDREVTPYANALVQSGDSTTTIGIKTDTGPVTVTGPEWMAMLIAAAQVRQPIWAAYFAVNVKIGQGAITTLDGIRDAPDWPAL